jgi:hypothetical protein
VGEVGPKRPEGHRLTFHQPEALQTGDVSH